MNPAASSGSDLTDGGDGGNRGQNGHLAWLPNWADAPLAALVTVVVGIIFISTVWSLVSVPEPERESGPPLDMARVAAGHRLYLASCAACHGPDARGLPSLGKNLRMGLSATLSDQELADLIMRGRVPGEPGHTATTPMPPQGGRPDYGQAEIADIVVYLRGLQDPTRITGPEPEVHVAVLDDHDVEPVASTDVASTQIASVASVDSTGASGAAGISFDKESALRGKRVYMNCIACHGKDAKGLANLGADLLHSEFVKTSTDEQLMAFIKKGRLASDPDTKMKLNMPAKGGNPALKDNQIQDVIAYLRSLQAEASASK